MRKVQQLSIDGFNVDVSKARFADTFEVAERDERLLAYDEDVVYVVVARVSTPSFRESKGGEVSRVNVLKVKEARLVRDEDAKVRLLKSVGFDHSVQPSLFGPDPEPEPTVSELEEHGVRFVDNEPEVVDEPTVEPPEEEPDEIDADMAAFLALTKEIGDEYENEPEDFVPRQEGDRRIVGEAKGMAEKDPILKKFLEVG